MPNASAGAAFHSGMASGKFHGVMSATTPNGSRSVNCSAPGSLGRDNLAHFAHRFAGVVAQDRDAPTDFAARFADRLADLARQGLRQLLLAVRDRDAPAMEVIGAGDARERRHAPNASAAAVAARWASSATPSGT